MLAACQQAEDARSPATELPVDSAVAGAAAESGSMTVNGEFSTPESVLYDETNDVYLVSNINRSAG